MPQHECQLVNWVVNHKLIEQSNRNRTVLLLPLHSENELLQHFQDIAITRLLYDFYSFTLWWFTIEAFF